MRFRALNQLYAWLFGYFWLPCPACGRKFGGHEWKDRDGKESSIAAPDGHDRVGICPDCTRAGVGGRSRLVFWGDLTGDPFAVCEWCKRPTAAPLALCDQDECRAKTSQLDAAIAVAVAEELDD